MAKALTYIEELAEVTLKDLMNVDNWKLHRYINRGAICIASSSKYADKDFSIMLKNQIFDDKKKQDNTIFIFQVH